MHGGVHGFSPNNTVRRNNVPESENHMKLLHEYRVAQQRLISVKAEDRPWAAIEKVWDAYADCSAAQRRTLLKRLTLGQRAFVALNGLEAEVNNGGIHQFFWNSTGELAEEALAGLQRIGAGGHERLLRKALRLFGNASILRSRRRRQKVLREISEERMEKLFDEPFFELEQRKNTQLDTFRRAYFKKHNEEFVLPEGQEEEQPKPLAAKQEYRVKATRTIKLAGEKFQWALVKNLWHIYWQELKAGQEEFRAFLPALSKGQRAVAVLLILKNGRNCGGLHHFFRYQAGADVLVAEASSALKLLQADRHDEVFAQAIRIAGNLPDLNRTVAEQSRLLDKAKEEGDATSIDAARKAFRAAYDAREKRADEIYESLESVDQRLGDLLASKEHDLDNKVEVYVRTHTEEFFV